LNYQKSKNIMKTLSYKTMSLRFGAIGVLWYENRASIKVVRIVMPKPLKTTDMIIKSLFPYSVQSNSSYITSLCRDIDAFLRGKPIIFALKIIDLSQLNDFQRKVILLERKIPRGRISTYGRLAAKLGCPRGARAVGQALAKNPFPLIIPCHRTIRSNFSLGGYIGGHKMKRKLLELEGIEFDQKGRVVTKDIW
jgi:methylated-DNA-[protein]-cysteine S-methyltransferase